MLLLLSTDQCTMVGLWNRKVELLPLFFCVFLSFDLWILVPAGKEAWRLSQGKRRILCSLLYRSLELLFQERGLAVKLESRGQLDV